MADFGRAPPVKEDATRLSRLDLVLIAAMQADPAQPSSVIARQAGISPTTAYRRLGRLRRAGVIEAVRELGVGPDQFQAVVLLRVDHGERRAIQALEKRLCEDPEVWRADQISGPHCYQLRTVHRDLVQAKLWQQAYRADPAVSEVTFKLCRMMFVDRSEVHALLNVSGAKSKSSSPAIPWRRWSDAVRRHPKPPAPRS